MLTARQILKQSRLSEQQQGEIDFCPVDHERPFIPEKFTQLYHTPLYETLSREQRLAYNQLSGLSGNEHFMLFESGFTNRVISRLTRHPLVLRDPELAQCLHLMLQEELRHCEMFRQLNQHCRPELYQNQAYYFTRMSRLESLLLWCLTHIPGQLIFLLWLVLIIEEHSNHISGAALAQQPNESLGSLEPNFIKVHRAHLQDEIRHVHIDARLLSLLTDQASRVSRKSSAFALKSLLMEIMTPKRAGLAVIRMLAIKHPELASRCSQLQAAVLALKIDPGFALTLTHDASRPLSSLLQQTYPEFFSNCKHEAASSMSRKVPVYMLAMNYFLPAYLLLGGLLIASMNSLGNGLLLLLFWLYLLPPVCCRLILMRSGKPQGQVDDDSPVFRRWWMVSQLQVLYSRISILEELLRIVPGLYSLWLGLWGAQVSLFVYWSPGVLVFDRYHLSIDRGVMIGGGCRIGAHAMRRNDDGSFYLVVAPMTIERDCVIGFNSAIGPGVHVYAGETIPAGKILKPHTTWRDGRALRPSSDSQSSAPE
jgi:hypothetical protein